VRPKVPNDELRRRRLALGWSQERLANELNRRMAAAGLAGTCTGRRVARWERGQARPGTDYAPFLAEALGCTLAQVGLADGHNAGLAWLAA
jgi:transcriptional regulator with XRE-family HTH domain